MSSAPSYGDPETRHRILAATRAVLAEEGARLTLAHVAKRASVSRQAVYLHFGDRTGLLVALVRHMDETLDLADSLARVHAAPDGPSLLEAAMHLNTTFWAQVLPVAQVLEAAQHEDEALGAAWRDRMSARLATFRDLVQTLSARGDLAPDWTVEDATAALYALAHFDTWRELTLALGWGDERYVEVTSRLLVESLLARPGRRPTG